MDNTKTDLVEETTLNRKIPGTKNSTRSGRKSALDFRKYTKQIWLAGLGAFFVLKKKEINYLTHWSRLEKSWNLRHQILLKLVVK